MNKIKPQIELYTNNDKIDWDLWLHDFNENLNGIGYIRYNQKYKNSDFCYWKVFEKNNDIYYQVGVSFYDFRKYQHNDPTANRIGTSYECIIIGADSSISMNYDMDIDLPHFEKVANEFYKTILNTIHYGT